jgi:hypothetical protein
MFYEDYKIRHNNTISKIGIAYGYKADDWRKLWEDSKNTGLKNSRKIPEHIQPGDTISVPIPWRVVSKTLTNAGDGGRIVVERDGELGTQLTWVQTVYRHNQPIGPNPNPFCVDGCTPDDDLPFYWTNAEIAADPSLRKKFKDHSSRSPPTAAQGTTKWRAVVSLAVVTEKRVTVWNSLVWGWNMQPNGTVTMVGPRAATGSEVGGHLNLLRKGVGTGPLTFGKAGWIFRTPPP